MKKLLFITATRADFGKIKSLIRACENAEELSVQVFVTGMHMLSDYGETYQEIANQKFENIYYFINHSYGESMDVILAKTIQGLADYVREFRPDMIIVHGDRSEALAGAVVGSLQNVLVGHIEGGELSGTVDESLRHSISKLSHVHFVANDKAKSRLVQMGENPDLVFTIGSPDIDVMLSKDLPTIESVKKRYEIPFDEYGLVLFHPVTTEIDTIHRQAGEMVEGLKSSKKNWVVIYPNNDHGRELIMDVYSELKWSDQFLFYPSIRFDYFLTLLFHCSVVVGNSSAGVREAPFYAVPSVNVGTRQNARSLGPSIFNVRASRGQVREHVERLWGQVFDSSLEFGDGQSTEKFMEIMAGPKVWEAGSQKRFHELGEGD
ncbi:UDP-N-acetylglucosamine 2-epimerase [Spiribacter sp. 218]|uniref:UDP-N-acetylglucosamine 2-epimerase n=1 Tax=Spiribacter pallidus TaxID=1987936 RepID=UPI00349FD08F